MPPLDSQPRAGATDLREQRFESLLFWVASLSAVVPLFIGDYPPLQDMPQHLAAIRVLHSLDDPLFQLAQHFELHPLRTQYLTFYLLADLLAFVLPLPWVGLLLTAAVVVAMPFAVRSLSRALGGDGSAGLLALPLTYNAHLILGFVNFLAAVPLSLYGLALAARQRRGFSSRRALGLSLVLALTFLTHVVPFAFLALGTALLALGPGWRACALRLMPLVPGGLLSLLWLAKSPAGQATAGAAAGDRANYRDAARAVDELPMWLTDVFHGETDTALLWAFVGLFLLAFSVSLAVRPRAAAPGFGPGLRLWLLPVVAAVLYFVAPSGYAWIWPIAPRFALLFLLLCLPLLPASHPVVRRGILSLAFGLSLSHTALTARAFAGFAEEVGEFDQALAAIPPGQRVAGLIFDRGSRHVRFAPFIHFVAHYQARKGGAVMFTFADFPQSPFVFREGRRPPRVPPRWEWMPQRVNPAVDLSYYDYVLVRGGPGRVARQTRFYRPLLRTKRWSVWQRKR